MKKVVVIGSGFSALSSACYLAKSGYEVVVLEKNDQLGGRARMMEVPIPGHFDTVDNALTNVNKKEDYQHNSLFRFDMGPSWYWMPDVFEKFFGDFGKKSSDYYQLRKVEPYFRIFHEDNKITDLPSEFKDILSLFDRLEPDGKGANKLLHFLKEAEFTYQKSINDYMLRPSYNFKEFLNWEFISGVIKGGLFKSYEDKINAQFQSKEARELLKFPTLFLGGTPKKTPYLYNLMAYTALVHGTWYPLKGMNEIVKAMVALGTELGVTYYTKCEVKKIEVDSNKVSSVFIQDLSKGQNSALFNNSKTGSTGIFGKINITDFYDIDCDFVVAGADYHFVEQTLLDPKYRQYSEKYWDTRVLSPSAICFYLGVNKILPNLHHHNLFFDTDFNNHAEEIYEDPKYPTEPLFYVCAPSKTDRTVAPLGCENLFILIPIAPGLRDSEATREKYYKIVMDRMQKKVGFDITPSVIYKKSYSIQNFEKDYNSFKGNAYGLANTLMQTAIFKPSIVNPKVKNLVFCGQMTVPGPGVPPALYSGKIAAMEVKKRIV